MSSPDISTADVEAVAAVLAGPHLSLGPATERFESKAAGLVGRRHAVAVSSGTAGLHAALIAAGVTDGDLVITTPFSFVASANVILYERAVPLFVDVDEATGNIDGARVAETLGAHPGVAAIIPVHVFGQPADMDPITATASAHGVPVVEDACEAIGSEYLGRKAGALGDLGVFAFYPNKQMTTGEGGLVATDDDDLAVLVRSLRNQGRDEGDSWLTHSRLGFNYRMDEMSAALGIAQLDRLEELIERRGRVAGWYSARLAGTPGVQIPGVSPNTTRMSWFCYVIRVADGPARARLMSGLEKEGIPSRPYFSPIHLQPYYRERFGYERGMFPVAEKLGDTSLALPFSSVMTQAQVERVCSVVVEVAGR